MTNSQLVEIKVKSIAPYGKGYQVNAFIDGVESEMTFYGYTKRDAIEAARKVINREGRLPHEPYKGANEMTHEIIAANQWRKLISGAPYGENEPVEIKVEAKLYRLGSNEFPYFSITGEISKRDKRFRDPVITCGSIHEDILRVFPSLAPLVLVHGSGPDGQPMHAEANARYWAGLCTYPDGSPMGELNLTMLAKHLQADKDTARELHKGLTMGLPWDTVTRELKLIELWSDQAGKARALLMDVREPANA